MYIMKKRVPYSEIGESSEMTLPAIVESLQDCATFHSQDSGITLKWLMENGLGWVTVSWRLLIRRRPAFGEEIEVETRPYRLAHFIGKRSFEVRGEGGESLVLADSQWVFSDIVHGKNYNLPDDFIKRYGIDEPFVGSVAPRQRLRPADDMAAQESFVVGLGHLDTNHHVNNVQYIRMAMPYLPKETGEFRIEYLKSAHLGDVIIPKIGTVEGVDVITLEGQDGSIYAIMNCAKSAGM